MVVGDSEITAKQTDILRLHSRQQINRGGYGCEGYFQNKSENQNLIGRRGIGDSAICDCIKAFSRTINKNNTNKNTFLAGR